MLTFNFVLNVCHELCFSLLVGRFRASCYQRLKCFWIVCQCWLSICHTFCCSWLFERFRIPKIKNNVWGPWYFIVRLSILLFKWSLLFRFCLPGWDSSSHPTQGRRRRPCPPPLGAEGVLWPLGAAWPLCPGPLPLAHAGRRRRAWGPSPKSIFQTQNEKQAWKTKMEWMKTKPTNINENRNETMEVKHGSQHKNNNNFGKQRCKSKTENTNEHNTDGTNMGNLNERKSNKWKH